MGFSYHVFPMCFCIFSFSFCNFLLFAYVFLEVRRNRFGASIPGFAGKYIHILIHISKGEQSLELVQNALKYIE